MEVYKYNTGYFEVNTYIVVNSETREAIAIDIGGHEKYLELESLKRDFKIKYVLLTHGHFDHIWGVKYFQDKGVIVYCSKLDSDKLTNGKLNQSEVFGLNFDRGFNANVLLDGGEELELCGLKIKVISCPGHSEGGLTYIIDNYMFTGDTLLKDSYGRYDFYDGNFLKLKQSIDNLFTFDENSIVCPGHGEMTNIKKEKEDNPINYDYY